MQLLQNPQIERERERESSSIHPSCALRNGVHVVELTDRHITVSRSHGGMHLGHKSKKLLIQNVLVICFFYVTMVFIQSFGALVCVHACVLIALQ